MGRKEKAKYKAPHKTREEASSLKGQSVMAFHEAIHGFQFKSDFQIRRANRDISFSQSLLMSRIYAQVCLAASMILMIISGFCFPTRPAIYGMRAIHEQQKHVAIRSSMTMIVGSLPFPAAMIPPTITLFSSVLAGNPNDANKKQSNKY